MNHCIYVERRYVGVYIVRKVGFSYIVY